LKLTGRLEYSLKILAVFTGFSTEEFGVSYRSGKITEFITFTGLGIVDNTVLAFAMNYS
jgi:hypothetical protein